MERQFKYIYKGKEVSKEEFTNVVKEMFKWFDSNTINAVDYSSVSDFLGENYKSKGEINKHLKGVLDGIKSDENLQKKIQTIWYGFDPTKDSSIDKRLTDLQEEFKKAINNSVSDGDFSKRIIKTEDFKQETFGKLGITPSDGKDQKSTTFYTNIEGKEPIKAYNYLDNKERMNQKFAEAGEKAGEKHTHPFLQSYNNLKGGESAEAYKETEGKLFYELDWGFITQMAERMASNKKESKYNLWNWKKPMTPKGIEDLKQATLRHLLAVLDGVYEDDNREFGHIEAISDNMMMINYQLKNNLK